MNKSALNIGELIFAGFHGTHITPQLKSYLMDYPVGGLILFSRNIQSYAQWNALIHGIQQIRSEQNMMPLLIAVDEEGGTVSRLPNEDDTLPSARALAQTQNLSLIEHCGYITGTRLRRAGCSVNFAPVLDVNSTPYNPGIGIRSYGSDANTVTRCGLASMRGLAQSGICACAKHFPGKGAISRDSHQELPVCSAPLSELNAVHIAPFRAAIDTGIPLIMTSHACYPALANSHEPATLSHSILTGILRNTLGYDGVIISDDIEMGALKTFGQVESVAYRALSAGCDMVLICHSMDKQIKTYNYLQEKANSDEAFYKRCTDALFRINALKQRLNSYTASPPLIDSQCAEATAEQCVSIISNKKGILPIRNKNAAILVAGASFRSAVEVEIIGRKMYDIADFASNLKNSFRKADCIQWDLNPTSEHIKKAHAVNLEEYDYIFLVSNNALLYAEQKKLLDFFVEKAAEKCIFAAIKNPEDCECYSHLSTCIATYGYNKANISVLVKKLIARDVSN